MRSCSRGARPKARHGAGLHLGRPGGAATAKY